MLKTACTLTGDNYLLLSKDTPASKKKVTAMALAMMVPVLIWVFNGFMLSFQVLEAGWGWSVITGLVCGLMVFFVEKLIVMANGNGWLTLFRICIGFIVAALGSIAIDEVVFKKDIDTSVASLKKESIKNSRTKAAEDFENESGYTSLTDDITKAQSDYDIAEKNVLAEADGTSGTGKRGAGEITALKDQKATIRKAALDRLLEHKATLESQKQKAIDEAANKTRDSYNENALLIRIKALFALVKEDGYMLITYLLFTALLFFFEFLVVILKLTWKKTNYEKRVELIEEIGARRMEFLRQKNTPLTDPGIFMPQFELARQSMQKNGSVFN